MGAFNDVRTQVGQAPPQISGRFVTSAQKGEMVRQRTPFWVIAIDPQPRANTRFANSNGSPKYEWVYHCVPLQGGEEFVLTLSSNWSRDHETPLLLQQLQQTGQPLGPAVLTFGIPPGGTRAMHQIADWDQSAPPPVQPMVQVGGAGQALAGAMGRPAVGLPPLPPPNQPVTPWIPPQAVVQAQAAPPAALPWRPVPGSPVAPQTMQAPVATVTPPAAPPAPATPTPAPSGPVVEGGRAVGLAPDGQTPIQYQCGCLASRTTRQVYQPCPIHATQPNPLQAMQLPQGPQAIAAPANQPVIAQLTSGTHQATGNTATAVCPRCQQQITGEVTQVGQNRYVTHNNCPGDPNPQAFQLLKV
jgi:hypothetical protein